MIKGIIDTMKVNKGVIIKRTLLIGGAVLGLAIVARTVMSKGNAEEGETEETVEVDVPETDEVVENG